jgi:ribosome biogenesis GTPase A
MTVEEKEKARKEEEQRKLTDARRRDENARRITRGPNKMNISLIVGLPNVGKSTLINQLIGKGTAGVAPKPGWTRGQQLYRIDTLNPTDSTHKPLQQIHLLVTWHVNSVLTFLVVFFFRAQ